MLSLVSWMHVSSRKGGLQDSAPNVGGCGEGGSGVFDVGKQGRLVADADVPYCLEGEGVACAIVLCFGFALFLRVLVLFSRYRRLCAGTNQPPLTQCSSCSPSAQALSLACCNEPIIPVSDQLSCYIIVDN